MDFSEKWGTDVNEATELALKDLKLTIDEVDVEILEEPSRGFFGLGQKLAKVRVTKKEAEKEPEVKPEPKQEKPKQESKPKQKPKEETLTVSKKPDNLVDVEADNEAVTFIKNVTEQMGLNLTVTAQANDESLFIDINGRDAGSIIGKRGQTLDSIQYLTSLVANKNKDKYMRVVVDAENYRAKREKTLQQLANRIANKVIKTKKSVKLEPMNPYERKVIHATLQGKPEIVTRSEGEEPYRRVIIELKK